MNGEVACGNMEVKCGSGGVQTEMRTSLLDTGRKATIAVKRQKGPELGIHLAQSSSLTMERMKIRERENEADVLSTYMES